MKNENEMKSSIYSKNSVMPTITNTEILCRIYLDAISMLNDLKAREKNTKPSVQQ